ncbi:polymer-forming cytoskeletal protein, partial [bacterium]|nr:polymer-forming cytoskeletal protein [bacterium]
QDAVIDGKLKVSHSIRIDGTLNGELESSDTITIGMSGKVDGTLIGENIIIGGTVEGSLKSSGKITLETGSKFSGDLEAAKLVIIEGATFNGRSTMGTSGKSEIRAPRKLNLEPESRPVPVE